MSTTLSEQLGLRYAPPVARKRTRWSLRKDLVRAARALIYVTAAWVIVLGTTATVAAAVQLAS